MLTQVPATSQGLSLSPGGVRGGRSHQGEGRARSPVGKLSGSLVLCQDGKRLGRPPERSLVELPGMAVNYGLGVRRLPSGVRAWGQGNLTFNLNKGTRPRIWERREGQTEWSEKHGVPEGKRSAHVSTNKALRDRSPGQGSKIVKCL